MKISYSAPAKVILSGEHAVVYGKPALVSALDLRLNFTVTNSDRSSQDGKTWEEVKMVAKKVKDYLIKQKIQFKDKKYNFKIDSNIPVKQRLGSSAAFCVASVAALLEFYSNREFDKETINSIAYNCEKYFHKNASGVDVSTSCFGGFIFYRKEFEFLKNITSLNFKLPKKFDDNLFLIYSGDPLESTGEMVEAVGKLYNRKPQFVEEVLNDIEKTTKRLVVSIVKEDVGFFIRSIVDNQILLDMLGVVSKRAKNLLKDLEPYGYGKVTGGGGKKEGSGYMLFYADKIKEFENYCRLKNITYFKFIQSYEGVKKSKN
ncbi:mevalonate kinase [Candidatus Roizmanbacteria bacterium RIFCSPLOWO2_01_FULL_37_16]|uniref:Mevalonate kinase n=1 Tax=Candidatus Roizmanbacteria bacterium RIFCSPLOWO2_01_FULL_37_16 TaxID=1802058 RepID=A0A1F7ING1_9BACT|nr:MAG: mevalonate kinase [Candidatus Roizmanbacteria bacterium RIFCSPLOWO2_01_FULL_37_16]